MGRIALLGLTLLGALGAAHGEGGTWLSLDTPSARPTRVGFEWIEVRGQAGPRGTRGHDVVIVLDLSDSTIRPSGVDLDGDGAGGRTDPALLRRLAQEPDVRPGLLSRLEESDFEDSVLAAELAAAQVLIERLDPRRFRVGIVHFSDDAWRIAPVGSSEERLRHVLERIRRTFFRDLGGTNFAAGIEAASASLARAQRPNRPLRGRSVLFLSDGEPTLPVHANRAAESARSAAADAATAGVRLYAFALGSEALDARDVYRDMARLTGGRFEKIERPADAIARLRRVDLADLSELLIENRTTGRRARAVRVFPDGSFDGFVELGPGMNQLVVTARASDGRVLRVERVVVLKPAGSLSADEVAAERLRIRGLRKDLRRRTRETELWAAIERGRRDPRLRAGSPEVELHPEKRSAAD